MNTVVFYINGTGVKAGSPISSVPSLMNTLYTLTLTPESEEQAQKIGQLAWCLDGNCSQGNESPLEIGAAKDLQSEIDRFTSIIKSIVDDANGEKLRAVLVGFSRGGVAVLKAALDLQNIPSDLLELHICAVDPAPGASNVSAVALNSWAKTVSDLRACKNIQSIQLLYASAAQSNERVSSTNFSLYGGMEYLVGNLINLYAGMCFNAIKPLLPPELKGDIGVQPGSHVEIQAMIYQNEKLSPASDKSLITFHRVVRFLLSCGVQFDESKLTLDSSLNLATVEPLKAALQRENAAIQTVSTYALHNDDMVEVRPYQMYLNTFHQRVDGVEENLNSCALTVSHSGTPLLQREGIRLAWAGKEFFDGLVAPHREMISQVYDATSAAANDLYSSHVANYEFNSANLFNTQITPDTLARAQGFFGGGVQAVSGFFQQHVNKEASQGVTGYYSAQYESKQEFGNGGNSNMPRPGSTFGDYLG